MLDLIFTAFQQHQYYNFRDLVHKTKQPPVSVMEPHSQAYPVKWTQLCSGPLLGLFAVRLYRPMLTWFDEGYHHHLCVHKPKNKKAG